MYIGHILAATVQELTPANISSGPKISTSDVDSMLSSVFEWGIIVAALLAAVYLSIAGFQYLTTEGFGKKGEAKKRITQIIFGLVLALCTVLILNVINPATLTVAFGRFGEGKKIGAERDPSLMGFILTNERPQQKPSGSSNANKPTDNQKPEENQNRPTNGEYQEPELPTGNGELEPNPLLPPLDQPIEQQPVLASVEGDVYEGAVSESNARLMLNGFGITVNDPNRTSLEGIQATTLYGLVQEKNAMKIDSLVLTGGTEAGHAAGTYSHANGYKVDIGKNSNATNWSTIKDYFESRRGRPLNLGDSFTVPGDGYNMTVYYHTGTGEHFDLKFVPTK